MPSRSDDERDLPFSALLRERTSTVHGDAEGSSVMADLVAGTLSPTRIGEVFAQHLPVYRALEGTAARLADDPVVAPFLVAGLARTPALEHDVALLLGADALETLRPSPATAEYVDRIEATAAWPGGFVAHHYTRYMGDLSGGQYIGRALARAHPDLDLHFYAFDAIASPKATREHYRACLDAAPWSSDEQERVVDEVLVAYDLTGRLLAELDGATA